MGNMRELNLEECMTVSGGFWSGDPLRDSFIPTPDGVDERDPYRDDDEDGILNMFEGIVNMPGEIVVTASKMTPEQQAAYEYHREVAFWIVNSIHFGLLARVGASGLTGIVGAASSMSIEAIAENKERMIDNLAHLNYQRDGADGSYDKRVDPGYITGEKTLPR